MKLSYKEKYSNRVHESKLSDIVTEKAEAEDNGMFERTIETAEASILFTEKLIEILYKKGIIDKKELFSLAAYFSTIEMEDNHTFQVVSIK